MSNREQLLRFYGVGTHVSNAAIHKEYEEAGDGAYYEPSPVAIDLTKVTSMAMVDYRLEINFHFTSHYCAVKFDNVDAMRDEWWDIIRTQRRHLTPAPPALAPAAPAAPAAP